MKRKYISAAIVSALCILCAFPAFSDSTSRSYREAVRLYKNGFYQQARDMFESIASDSGDLMSEGYSVLCSSIIRSEGYESLMDSYLEKYPQSMLAGKLHFQRGLDLFDQGDYTGAKEQFISISVGSIDKSQVAELTFKRAYCDYSLGNLEQAMDRFKELEKMPYSNFTSPSRYLMAYMYYSEKNFVDAEKYFSLLDKDPRFSELAEYYLLECRFMEKDYKYVSEKGPAIYQSVPDARKVHLARIISESYLILGYLDSAKEYYDLNSLSDEKKTRTDYFYSGSMLYALKDYRGAVENYTKMQFMTDSLGQIASYQMGNSYLQLKNKVEAMDAFKTASETEFDAVITEDALFNYAKLAFDLNQDGSVFKRYLDEYSESKSGDDIYTYMALSMLANHDYAGAVEVYDMIDDLSPDMRSNYMKANYLRANQLIEMGSWRDAIPCLQSAAFYTGKKDPFNQLTRYWLAEAYFNSGRNEDAIKTLVDLYNNSALEGREEGKTIPYNIAYNYFQKNDYVNAAKWFDTCVSQGESGISKDALIRRADCDFARNDYKSAIKSYQNYLDRYDDANDIYPYYQQGLSYGLSGDKKKKVTVLKRVEQASSDAYLYSEALYELGRAYIDNKSESNAINCFQKLSKESKDYDYKAKSLIELGMISRNKRKYDEALAYYKQVVETLPKSAYTSDAMAAIESLYQTKGEPEEYLAYVESIDNGGIKSDSEKEDIYFNSVEQVYFAQNYQKTVSLAEKFIIDYPQGNRVSEVYFYLADSYKSLGQKEKAADSYEKAMAYTSPFTEVSSLNYADLSFELGHFEDAYRGYEKLDSLTQMSDYQLSARKGKMRSAYRSKQYDSSIQACDLLLSNASLEAGARREAEYLKAKSLLESSRRQEAFVIFKTLSADPSSEEGAEAAYLMIQDIYDRGDFSKVEDMVYSFSDKAEGQDYWLAKAFIVLGDSFAELDQYEQAKATFESIQSGYKPSKADDDVLDNVNMRLEKLSKLQ